MAASYISFMDGRVKSDCGLAMGVYNLTIKPMNTKELQHRLGHSFANPGLLDTALSHSSWANESRQPVSNNERLEFLGDAVLELCVSRELFGRFADAREGQLTRLRSSLVNEASLAVVARGLGLDREIRLGRGEELQGGRQRDSILSDAFEAVLAAIYLDGGMEAACGFIGRVFAPLWPEDAGGEQRRDNKSMLQEECQRRFGECPVYALAGSHGPEHARIFEIRVTLPDGKNYLAEETSCKKAEQAAAALALLALGENPPRPERDGKGI